MNLFRSSTGLILAALLACGAPMQAGILESAKNYFVDWGHTIARTFMFSRSIQLGAFSGAAVAYLSAKKSEKGKALTHAKKLLKNKIKIDDITLQKVAPHFKKEDAIIQLIEHYNTQLIPNNNFQSTENFHNAEYDTLCDIINQKLKKCVSDKTVRGAATGAIICAAAELLLYNKLHTYYGSHPVFSKQGI